MPRIGSVGGGVPTGAAIVAVIVQPEAPARERRSSAHQDRQTAGSTIAAQLVVYAVRAMIRNGPD
ncbi:MAG: hypothetical protein LBV34_06510 [Nocardiopsaceae bacterium]|nr:hypothetical protein [Nocardiopsaceae bacterium]